mmetsp:Transcript_69088/g.122179  ORF Transcript_69088/g.122179 Transcript_69088/m.122179 type:complete len:80 (+) Transcript_69088:120-359(+)
MVVFECNPQMSAASLLQRVSLDEGVLRSVEAPRVFGIIGRRAPGSVHKEALMVIFSACLHASATPECQELRCSLCMVAF